MLAAAGACCLHLRRGMSVEEKKQESQNFVEKVLAKLIEGDYEAAERLAEKNLRLYASDEGTALLETVRARARRAAVLKRVRARRASSKLSPNPSVSS